MLDSSLIAFNYSVGSNNFKKLFGINNLSISNSISYEQSYLLGGSPMIGVVNSPIEFSLSFDRSFVEKDPLLDYTGLNPISLAYISRCGGNEKIKFQNLYLTNYSAGFSVGELPVINTKFSTYSNVNKLNSNDSFVQQNSYTSSVPRLGSITITGNSAKEINFLNNIYSFDYSLDIKRQPYYSIGSSAAVVETVMPITINFSVNSKVAGNRLVETSSAWPSYLCEELVRLQIGGSFLPSSSFEVKVPIKLYDFQISVSGDGSNLLFPIKNATLTSSEIQFSSNNTPELKRNFIGYYGL
jgi:hypothetical protein